MSARCVACKSANKVTDVSRIKDMEVVSHYCGNCGATWGFPTVDQVNQAKQKQQRKLAPQARRQFHQTLRAGGGLHGVTTKSGPKPFADVKDSLPANWGDR